jgi:hypothetical protein
LNKSYNTAESLYHLVDRSLSYSLSKLSTDNLSIFNLSLELALKNQTISNLSSKLNAEYKYMYEENFIPSKITTINLNYSHSTIRSISQNGSNLVIIGNKTDPGYFVFIYNIKNYTANNLTKTFKNNSITNVFSSVANGKGFTFLVRFKNNSIGLVQYDKKLVNLTFFKNYTDFYPVGLSYNNNGYLVTGYSKQIINTTPPPPPVTKSMSKLPASPPTPPTTQPTTKIIQDLLYYNPFKNSIINLSSNLSSFQGYNFTNPFYNGTDYYLLEYKDPTGHHLGTPVLNLNLLSYNRINKTLENVSNLTLPIPTGETFSQANLSLSWDGAYFLISGSYSLPTGPGNSLSNPFLEIYNPATNLWANITGSINTKNNFTSNMIWNGTSFITALTNSSGSGLYYLGG